MVFPPVQRAAPAGPALFPQQPAVCPEMPRPVERLEKVFPGRKLKAERQGHSAFGLARRFAAYPVVKLTRRGGARNAWPESAFRDKLGSPVTGAGTMRSEERRVGKECRSRWSPY